jgi:peptidoglycan/xylan/chitin deacetylase (PgdA/CDA1 family)
MSTSRRTFLLAGLGLVATACAADDPGAGARSDPGPTVAPPAPATVATTAATTSTSAAPPPPPAPRFVVQGPAAGNRVALTFHTDGREDLARQLVDQLHGTPGTCFIVGSWLDAHPDWAPRLRAAGLELANHTYSHPSSGDLSAAALAADIARCRDVLTRLTGAPGRFFRPSGTDDGTATPEPSIMSAATTAGYPEVIGFDVDPLDFRDPGVAAVSQRTLAALHPGAIISLHFGHAGTVAAMPAILRGLQERGLEPVTLATLLAP